MEREAIIKSLKKKIWLKRYRKAKFKAESLWRQAIEWQETIISPSCKVLDGMPGNPGFSNNAEVKPIKHLTLIDDAKAATAQADKIRCEISAAIDTVVDEDLIEILTLRYIEGLKWEIINDMKPYSRQHSSRLHKEALELIQIDQAELDKIKLNPAMVDKVMLSQNATK